MEAGGQMSEFVAEAGAVAAVGHYFAARDGKVGRYINLVDAGA